MQQLKIGLTGAQRGQLEKAAKKAGRTLSEECRRRLEASLTDDEMHEFARVAGREVAILAQIVLFSVFDKKTEEDLSENDKARLRSTLWRAMAVALTEYFTEIKPREFSRDPINPPPTEPDIRADAIGHAAAQGLFLWASGKAKSPYPELSWLFRNNEPESES
jgi:hypothetical protein